MEKKKIKTKKLGGAKISWDLHGYHFNIRFFFFFFFANSYGGKGLALWRSVIFKFKITNYEMILLFIIYIFTWSKKQIKFFIIIIIINKYIKFYTTDRFDKWPLTNVTFDKCLGTKKSSTYWIYFLETRSKTCNQLLSMSRLGLWKCLTTGLTITFAIRK